MRGDELVSLFDGRRDGLVVLTGGMMGSAHGSKQHIMQIELVFVALMSSAEELAILLDRLSNKTYGKDQLFELIDRLAWLTDCGSNQQYQLTPSSSTSMDGNYATGHSEELMTLPNSTDGGASNLDW